MNFGPLVMLGEPKVGKTLVARTAGVTRETIQKEYLVWYCEGSELDISGVSYKLTEEDAGKEFSVEYVFQIDNEWYSVHSKPKRVMSVRMETLYPLYKYLLKREPDIAGLKFWADVLEQYEEQGVPQPLTAVIKAFQESESYKKETSK